ncbi:MAG TPA: Gfo/Idh/MocA family oxidoreductase [Opitutaceae bacterium]|nr:Gfo/Idh/MocA family oxidoreductase [Opitutaceae bacterium]
MLVITSTPKPHILILGCGSIGQRHLRAFAATQRCRLSVCDNRSEALAQLTEQYQFTPYGNHHDAFTDRSITGVIIATPAPSHVSLAHHALSTGRHVLVEKPLSLSEEGVEALIELQKESGAHAGVAYVQRFNPAIYAARTFLHSNEWGPVLQASFRGGQHFPTFRPAYRDIYYRDRAQGGGCIQDSLTHSIDTMGWILGSPTQVFCDAAHQALEGVQVEDTVSLNARFGSCLVNVALNQFQAPNEAQWDFHLSKGSVRIDVRGHRWGKFALGASSWEWIEFPHPGRDGQFLLQAHAFLDGCEGRPSPQSCTLIEGYQTLRFTLATLLSAEKQLPVSVVA